MRPWLFALVWYTGVAAVSSVLYLKVTRHDGWLPTQQLIHYITACGIYIVVEVLYLVVNRCLPDHITCERTTEGAHVIVAAHRAADSLRLSLPTILESFNASRVWVADNGFPDTDAQALCLELGVHYRFLKVGNKAAALLGVAKEIEEAHPNTKALVLLDDDTLLPPTFFVRYDLLAQPLVAGYCVGITIDRKPPWNMWEALVDFEYRSISYRNQTKPTLSFIHGICAVYKPRTMVTFFSKLCTLPHGLPFGEDAFVGIDLRMAGYRMLQDNHNIVKTYCPRHIISWRGRGQGFGASSLWKQRVMRWYLSWPRRLPSEMALVLAYDTGSWFGNIRYRLEAGWYSFIMFVSSTWVLHIAYILTHKHSHINFLVLHAALSGTALTSAIIRFIGFSPALRQGVNPLILLLVPLMNLTVCLLMCASLLVSLVWYTPWKRIDYHRCFAGAL